MVMNIIWFYDHDIDCYDYDVSLMIVTMNLMMMMKMVDLRTGHTIVVPTSYIDRTGFILNYILSSSGSLGLFWWGW